MEGSGQARGGGAMGRDDERSRGGGGKPLANVMLH